MSVNKLEFNIIVAAKVSGSVTKTESIYKHPLLSFKLNIYIPAETLYKSAVVSLEFQEYEYGGVPPKVIEFILASLKPLQDTFELELKLLNIDGSATINESTIEHEFES